MIINSQPEGQSSLPYKDTKPVGAADFYFAINATFRFMFKRLGEDGLRRYWTGLGSSYMAPVTQMWREGGLDAVGRYWRDFFDAEPGSDVIVTRNDDNVELNVRVCPAIKHMHEHGRDILPQFCQHCFFVSEGAARPAGFTIRVEGGDGGCRQTFYPVEAVPAKQRIEDIEIAGEGKNLLYAAPRGSLVHGQHSPAHASEAGENPSLEQASSGQGSPGIPDTNGEAH